MQNLAKHPKDKTHTPAVLQFYDHCWPWASTFALKPGTNLAKSLAITESLLAASSTQCVVISQSLYLVQCVCVFHALFLLCLLNRDRLSLSSEVLRRRVPPDIVPLPPVENVCSFNGQPSENDARLRAAISLGHNSWEQLWAWAGPHRTSAQASDPTQTAQRKTYPSKNSPKPTKEAQVRQDRTIKAGRKEKAKLEMKDRDLTHWKLEQTDEQRKAWRLKKKEIK